MTPETSAFVIPDYWFEMTSSDQFISAAVLKGLMLRGKTTKNHQRR